VQTLPSWIRHVAIPTPFPVGPVNCYILDEDPFTIVDPGMAWGDNTAILRAAIELTGRSINDVAQVVVTHGHPDHFGLAGWLADEADAIVVCGRPEWPKLSGAVDRTPMTDLVARLGIPEELRDVFRAFYEGVRELSYAIDRDRVVLLDDGDHVAAGGRSWDAHVTPGHSVGHLSLFDRDDRVLLSGDHLLACITPNPVLEPDDGPEGRRRSLVEYIASFDRFVRLDPLLVLPGHGPWFTDVPTLTGAMHHHHENRCQEILDVLEASGDRTPYELAGELFPHVRDFSVMLAVSEVVGHLDLLEDDGRVDRSTDSPARYQVR
jgi:glyoxylase-like metal-dependent hydrolase (beta-lactamase superfamily II)